MRNIECSSPAAVPKGWRREIIIANFVFRGERGRERPRAAAPPGVPRHSLARLNTSTESTPPKNGIGLTDN